MSCLFPKTLILFVCLLFVGTKTLPVEQIMDKARDVDQVMNQARYVKLDQNEWTVRKDLPAIQVTPSQILEQNFEASGFAITMVDDQLYIRHPKPPGVYALVSVEGSDELWLGLPTRHYGYIPVAAHSIAPQFGKWPPGFRSITVRFAIPKDEWKSPTPPWP